MPFLETGQPNQVIGVDDAVALRRRDQDHDCVSAGEAGCGADAGLKRYAWS
jgi:hypothetical protein